MAKNIIAAFAAKDNVVVYDYLVETTGNTVPTIKVKTTQANNTDNITVLAQEFAKLVNGIDNGDHLTVYLPNTVYKTISGVAYSVNYGKATSGKVAVANLSERQRSNFPADYISALVTVGDALIAKRGAVTVKPSRQIYRLRVSPTSINAPEMKTGDKLTFVAGNVNGKEKSVTSDGNFYVSDFSKIILGEYEVTVDAKGEITIPRLTRVSGEAIATGVAFTKFCSGEFTPEDDSQVRLINSIALVKICASKLPKLATVAQDAVTTA